ncbi:MAG: cardiolipin synthase, partial [Paraprevotella sp.]|nr:cardiolipin synthase [Paraprevotella sp.]
EHNFEINAFVYNTGIARKMRAQFIDDQQNCRLLNLERWVTRSAWQRIGTSLVRLFTPLL